MGKPKGNPRWKIMCVLVWGCALLGSLILADTVYAQTAQPAETDNVAVTIDIPVQAAIGGEPVPFSLSVQNTHPRQVVTFTALIVVEPGLAGPETWSAKVTPVADTAQGRIYRWSASVAPRRTVTLEATSHSGNEPGVQPALTVRLFSDQDRLVSTREIELVPSKKRAQGSINLSDISGDSCDLEEECLLLLSVVSPAIQPFSGGPFSTERCEFLGLDEEFAVDADRVEEDLFWFVTRTSGEYGRGCTISVPVTIGNRTFTVVYREALFTYFPVLRKSGAAGQ